MSTVKSIEDRILDKLRDLPVKGKREVLAFVDGLMSKGSEKTLKTLKKTEGRWKGLVEAEKLKEEIYADRLISTRKKAAF